MPEWQLDLFAAAGSRPDRQAQPDPAGADLAPAALEDEALIGAIPGAGLAHAPALAAEAGRRGLVAAVPALEQLCRRFAGFGLERAVAEQVAALRALARIGGAQAAHAVARLIARDAVQGPTHTIAVGIAADLRAPLPAGTVMALLQHADPDLRAGACRCAGRWPAAVPLLLQLAEDPESKVSVAAVCAPGRMGRRKRGRRWPACCARRQRPRSSRPYPGSPTRTASFSWAGSPAPGPLLPMQRARPWR